MNEDGQHENDQSNHGLYDHNEEVDYCGGQDDYEEGGGGEDDCQYEDHYNNHVESNDYCDGDNMDILTLLPSEILYSHDSIGRRFTNGILLTCVFAHLINGSLKVTDIPMIEVLSMNGSWWTVTGNRRLFLYRMLEEVGVVEKISVAKSAMDPTSKSFKKNFTNPWNGTKINCRQKSLQASLNQIVADWLSWKDVVAKWDPLKQVLAIHNVKQEDEEDDEDEEEDEEDSEEDSESEYEDEDDEDDDQEDEYYHNQYHYEDADDDQDDEYYQYKVNDDYYNNDTYESDHYNETDIDNGGEDSNCNQDEDDWYDYFSYNDDQDNNDNEDDGYCNVM